MAKSELMSWNNLQERYQILYHVVFEFLEHVVISHNELLCRAAIRYVGKDTQSLKDEKKTNAVKLCVFQKKERNSKGQQLVHCMCSKQNKIWLQLQFMFIQETEGEWCIVYFLVWNKGLTYLFLDFYTVLRFENEGYCLHNLLTIRTHGLVNVLTT